MKESRSDSNRRFFRRAVWACLATLGAFAFVLQLSSPGVKEAFSDIGLVVVAGLAAVACRVAAARDPGPAKRAWNLMALSSSFWMAGEAVWSLYELVLHKEPFPSPADIGYLGAVPLAAAALLSFPTKSSELTTRAKTAFDALIISASILCISWATVLGPLYSSEWNSMVESVIGLAYPLGDVALVSIVVFISARSAKGARSPLFLIGMGIMALAVADSGFAYQTLNDTYTSGNVIDLGWTAGYLLLGLAALKPAESGDGSATRKRLTHLGIVVPYVPVFLALAIIAVKQGAAGGMMDPLIRILAASIFGLVIVRQLITLFENISLNRNLEAKVEARTAELESALKKLAEAQRLQDEFVANTSHELRTPLTVMLGAVRTLQRPELGLNRDATLLMASAERNAMRMGRLVEDLLLTSTLGGEYRPAVQPFDASQELRGILAVFSEGDKEIQTSKPETLIAMGDAEKFRTVVAHLLSNAEKFAPAGTTIRVEAEESDGEIAIVVRDEGPGIPAPLRSKIFERFAQLDGGSTREHGGVGLGLFIARRLAESMGGKLEVEDYGPPGASFRFTLEVSRIDWESDAQSDSRLPQTLHQ